MRPKQAIFMAVLALGGLIVGCKAPDAPATMPATPDATMPAAPTTAAVVAPAIKPPDPTHVLTKDEPLYASEPSPTDPPGPTLPAGSKVLVVIPGPVGGYSQVTTDKGITGYLMTDGLKPLGK